MSSKKIVKNFVDDTTGQVLDTTYKMIKEYTNKKEAEKILKYIIKTVIKVGILYRNDQFSAEELKTAEAFKKKFHSLTMTVVSFHEVEFTYDCAYLKSSIEECRQLLQSLIERHLTEKSKSRIDQVFDFFCDQNLMDVLFQPEGKYREHMDCIVNDMHKMMDDGNL